MKAIRLIKIYRCQECPFHCCDDGIGGSYNYCDQKKKELTEFLHADPDTINGKRDFPEWCPLDVYIEK